MADVPKLRGSLPVDRGTMPICQPSNSATVPMKMGVEVALSMMA